jgi:hypothetical protein
MSALSRVLSYSEKLYSAKTVRHGILVKRKMVMFGESDWAKGYAVGGVFK